MTIKYLGQYGTIDDIGIFELLSQKGFQDTSPWRWLKKGKEDWRFEFSSDEFGSGEKVEVNLGRKKVNLPRTEVKKFDLSNICVEYHVEYPCELVAVYVNPHDGVTGVSLRKHSHDYFDGQMQKIIQELKAAGIEEPEGPLTKMEASCESLNAFFIAPDGTELCSVAHITYIPRLGTNSDIAEWYEIKVENCIQGRGIGSALEEAMIKELKKGGQKLLVVNGVFKNAVGYYWKKGYGFYHFNENAAYNTPHMDMPGHIMVKVLDNNIIENEIKGHLDWSKDTTQPRSLDASKQLRFV